MPFLRMFSKRNPGKDVESKAVYGNKDLSAVPVASSTVTLPDEHGVRLNAQVGNLTAASTTSFFHERGPSGLSMKPSSSTFHPSLFKLAGHNLSSSETAAAASTRANGPDSFASTIHRQSVSDDPYPTASTTPPGPSMDKLSKKTRKRRQKSNSSAMHQSFVQSDDSSQQSPDRFSISQSSPPDDSQLSMTQRLEEAAKRARLNAARQALQASTSAEEARQMPILPDKPLPPGPQPESFPTVPQDRTIDSFPTEPQLSTDPEPSPIDPTILVLEELLKHTSLEKEKLEWDTLEAQLLGPSPKLDIPTQPPPYQDTLTQPTPPQEDLQLQLDQCKTRVASLTKEKLEMVQHQHEKIGTVLQQLKQSRAETHKIALEQRRYRVLAESLASENDKLKKEKREALDRLSREIQSLETTNRRAKQEISDLQSKLNTEEAQNEQLNKEKANWQAQIDAMQHSLSETERRVRCLDQVTRQRFEAKQGGYASIGRSAMLHHSPHVKGPSMDIISLVARFNDEVFQTSTCVVENLDKVDAKEPAFITAEVTTRARQIWGLKVVSMLDTQSKDATAFNFLLLQNCLEVFITHWCTHIIEGYYPPQASFSDVLVELAAQTAGMSHAEKQQICGKQVKIISTESAKPEFDGWVNEIIGDLSQILLVGGVKMRLGRSDILPSRLLLLIQIAYDLRLALAEKDICGGLELAAPSPDLPFHPSFMQDAEEHANQGRKKSINNPNPEGSNKPEFIAGTSALGLKRTLNGQPGVYEMVVKPRVVLIRVLESTS